MTAPPPELTVFTIGVYGFDEAEFFAALQAKAIELLIDVRARRGLRGRKYAFANGRPLQAKLAQIGICYAHLKELAPTPSIRALQQQADAESQTKKRDRQHLCREFERAYKDQILKARKRRPDRRFQPQALLRRAMTLGEYPADRPLRRIALFCVETQPQACHRSLLASRLKQDLQLKAEVVHIMP